MKITHVSSPESLELRPYRTLRRPVELQQQGIFVAEGEKVMRRLLESRLETLSILLTAQWFEAYRSLLQTQGENLHALMTQKDLVNTGSIQPRKRLKVNQIKHGMAQTLEREACRCFSHSFCVDYARRSSRYFHKSIHLSKDSCAS